MTTTIILPTIPPDRVGLYHTDPLIPFEFSLPTSVTNSDWVGIEGHENCYAQILMRGSRIVRYAGMMRAGLSGDTVNVVDIGGPPNPAIGMFVPSSRVRLLRAALIVNGHIAPMRDVRIQAANAIRQDISARLVQEDESVNADIDVTHWSNLHALLVSFDIGYMRRPGSEWSSRATYALELVLRVANDAEITCAFDDSEFSASQVTSQYETYKTITITIMGLPGRALVHAQREGFRLAICDDSPNGGGLVISPRRRDVALYTGWGADASLLSCLNIPRDSVPANELDIVIDNRIESVNVGAASGNYYRNRVLEGNSYSAAPGSDWLNMGRCHAASAIVARRPDYIDVLRDGAVGLSLLRIHNVREDDGSMVLARNHPRLETNRQIPHPSSADQLLAGETPPTSYENDGRALGNGLRNARDGEHYEIGVVDDYLALAIDYQVARSRRQMLEMDVRRTNLLSGWSATPRDVGRTVSQACNAALLFDDYYDLMQVQCEGWIDALVNHWQGRNDLLGAALTGGRFFATWIHSEINGHQMCAPYEEMLLAAALEKFVRTFSRSSKVAIATGLGYLLSRSGVQMVRDRREGTDRPPIRAAGVDGFHVRYLVELRGNGLAPREENDTLGGDDYLRFCIQGLIAFRRFSAVVPRAITQGDADLLARASEVVNWFRAAAQNGEAGLRWGSV